VVKIDEWTPFSYIRAIETEFQRLQLHVNLAGLLKQFVLIEQAFVIGLRLFVPLEQVARTLQELLLTLAHLNQAQGVFGGPPLQRWAASYQLQGDLGEVQAICWALNSGSDVNLMTGSGYQRAGEIFGCSQLL
jgi:hypothetical protein